MAPRSIKRRAAYSAKPEENKQLFVNMPLDVLIEIFPYLEPLDLLHLARTTKALRAFLLNRNKCSILWKSAFSNIDGFPACPDHISAPAYTHLAFVPVCHGCFGPCETIEWDLRMRCCSSCWEDMMIPPFRSVYRRSHSTNRYDVNLPTASTHSKLDFAARDTDGTDFAVGVTFDSFPVVCSRKDLKTAKSRKRPKGVPMDEFVAEQNEFWDCVRKHARLCRDRHKEKLRVKAVQLTFVRKQRRRDIRNMISELCRPTGEVWLPYFSQLPEVRKPEPLTPTEWAEIQPRLDALLETVKTETIRNLYKSAIVSIREELVKDPAVKVKPETIDIATLPVVRSMLENDVHLDFTLDDAKTLSCMEDDVKKKLSCVVPQAIRKWSSDAVKELESVAREQLNLPPLSKPSCLPSVIFYCRQCNERLAFDKALSHPHLYKERCNETRHTSDMDMSTHERLLTEHYSWLPRDIGVLQIDVTVSRSVENLIRRMGKNPSRVAYDEMCRSTVKVACNLCRLPTNMDFKTAFEHCLGAHLWKKKTEIWTRIPARKITETSRGK